MYYEDQVASFMCGVESDKQAVREWNNACHEFALEYGAEFYNNYFGAD